ncbi:MAG: hypothetical protein QM689_04375 [Oscillospiraceae bacterium]
MALKDLTVNIGANTSGFSRGLKSMQSGMKSATSGLRSLAKSAVALAGVSAGIVGVVESMKSYVSLESSVSRVNSLFGDSAKYISYFATVTGKSLGMAESSAYQFAATYGNLFKGITSGAEENSKVTIAMMKASSVIASKTGRTMDDVMERIRSGLLGNTEAIEDLGVNVNVAMLETTAAFQKIADGRSWEQLTFQEQQQIRTLAILEQANNNFGTEVQKGSAYSLSLLSGSFKDLISYAGQFANAGLQPVIKALTQVAQLATQGLKSLAALMGLKVTTDSASSISDTASAQSGLADSTDEATKAAKKQQQVLAGFDEINTLQSADSTSTETSSSGTTGTSSVFDSIAAPEFEETSLDTSGVEKWIGKIKGLFSGFKLPSLDTGKLVQSLNNLKEPLKNLGAKAWDGLKWAWNNLLVPLGQWAVNDAAPAFLGALGGAADLLNAAIDALKPLAQWLWESFLQPLAAWTGGAVKTALDDIAGALSAVGDWISKHQTAVQNMAVVVAAFFAAWKVTELLGFIQKSGGVVKAIKAITIENKKSTVAKIADNLATKKATVLNAKTLIASLAKSLAARVADTAAIVASTAAKVAQAVATAACTVATTIATAATWAFNAAMAVLTSPILLVVAAIAAVIAIVILLVKHWDTVKAVALVVWDAIVGAFKTAVEGIKTAFGAVVDFFKAVWGGIKKAFSVVGEWFGKVFSGAWAGIKAYWSGVGKFFSGVWGGIKKAFSAVGTWFGKIFLGAWEGIKNVFSTVGDFFGGLWDTIKEKFSAIGSAIGDAIGGAFADVVNTILDFAENTINGFIRAINWAIGAINNIPGVKIDTINELNIQPLAKGGIVSRPTIAQVGEAGKEAVVPLENNTGWLDTIAQKLSVLINGGSSGGAGGDVYVYIGNEQLDARIVRAMRKQAIRSNGR